MKLPAFVKKYDTLLLALVAVVLANAAGTTLHLRADLTKNRVYTLSRASKRAVAALSEPLTIKVFFTSDLPAPYNTVERYVRDLLAEYADAGNRYFNYEFYSVTGAGAASRKNQDLARSYGVTPVQVRVIDQDQVKFQNALMGMVLIHGDITEAIPSITTTDGLEYRITSAITRMANKVSALVNLKDKVAVKLYLSSSLRAVGPSIDMPGLAGLPAKIAQLVEKLNGRYYGKLSFAALDPSGRPDLEKEAASQNVLFLHWNSFRDRGGRIVAANRAYAGLVVSHDGRSETVPLIHVQTLPPFGAQYSLAGMDELEQTLSKTVESVINVNEEVGYLSDHGTLPLEGGQLANFQKQLSGEYRLRPVSLQDGPIPDSLPLLVIAGPRTPFSDYELYQIDQFLMKGKSLAVFLDPLDDASPQGGAPYQGGQPSYRPLHTGLGKLLVWYGLRAEKSYVFDESCYHQQAPALFGGGEQPLYFAPVIRSGMIAGDVPYLRNLKGLIMLKASPVTIDENAIKENGLTATRLFSSSNKSWVQAGNVDLNPLYLQPPTDSARLKSTDMAYMVEGSFPSYFADKPVPEKPATAGKAAGPGKKPAAQRVAAEGAVIRQGQPGKIFLIGTSELLKDNLFDEDGANPNAQFVMNVVDALNNRVDNAVMRTKVQSFNPLRETGPGARTFIKSANIVGLPLLVVAAGLVVWFRRSARKRAIRRAFAPERPHEGRPKGASL